MWLEVTSSNFPDSFQMDTSIAYKKLIREKKTFFRARNKYFPHISNVASKKKSKKKRSEALKESKFHQ
jgi:hypothetical protein